MKRLVFILAIFFSIASCSTRVIDVKSPCVSNEDGPCGPKKPINNWWLKNSANSYKQTS